MTQAQDNFFNDLWSFWEKAVQEFLKSTNTDQDLLEELQEEIVNNWSEYRTY